MTIRRSVLSVLVLFTAGCGGTTPKAGPAKPADDASQAAPAARQPAAPTVRAGSMEEAKASIEAMSAGLSRERLKQFSQDLYDLGRAEGLRQGLARVPFDPLQTFRIVEGMTVDEVHQMAELARQQQSQYTTAPAASQAGAPDAPGPGPRVQSKSNLSASGQRKGGVTLGMTKSSGETSGLSVSGSGSSDSSAATATASTARAAAVPPRVTAPAPTRPPPPRPLAASPAPGAAPVMPGVARDAGPDPSRQAETPIEPSYTAERLVEEPEGIFADPRECIRDVAPDDGLLVGVRVGYFEFFGGAKIAAIQPVYQVGASYVEGGIWGDRTASLATTVVARPGYAVGAMRTQTGAALDAFRLEFMRAAGDRLDPNDSYLSAWIGDRRGGGPGEVDGAGRFVIGIVARTSERAINALGLVLDDGPGPVSVAAARRGASGNSSPAATDSGPDPSQAAAVRLGVDYDPGGLADDPATAFDGPGEPFRDIAPDRGLLVGAFVRHAETADGPVIRALQPIYQVGDTYRVGASHGESSQSEVDLVARPGYAVGSVETQPGGSGLASLRVAFRKVGPQGLEPKDAYYSPWLGAFRNDLAIESRGDSRFAVGIVGRGTEREILALDLVRATDAVASRVPEAEAEAGPGDDRPEADSGPDPSQPAEIAIELEYSRNRLDGRPPSGFGDPREGFRSIAPRRGLLVGLRAAVGEVDGRPAIVSLKPIYQVGGTYHIGPRLGGSPEAQMRIVARPGYAVAGIDARNDGPLSALRFEFMRAEGARLDPDDSYLSPWVGRGRGRLSAVSGDGRPVVGIIGRGTGRAIDALGLVLGTPEGRAVQP
jgi:hypothetical protein